MKNVSRIIWDVFVHYVPVKKFLFSLPLAFGVAHQAVEEVNPGGDTILVQG